MRKKLLAGTQTTARCIAFFLEKAITLSADKKAM